MSNYNNQGFLKWPNNEPAPPPPPPPPPPPLPPKQTGKPLRRSKEKIFNFWAGIKLPYHVSPAKLREIFNSINIGEELNSHRVTKMTMRNGKQVIGAEKNNRGTINSKADCNNMTIKFLNTDDNKSRPAATIMTSYKGTTSSIQFQGGGDLNKLFLAVKHIMKRFFSSELLRTNVRIAQETAQFYITKKIDQRRKFSGLSPIQYMARIVPSASAPLNMSNRTPTVKNFPKRSIFKQPVQLPRMTPAPVAKIRVGPDFITIRYSQYTIKIGTNHIVQYMGTDVDPSEVFAQVKAIVDMCPAGLFVDEEEWKPQPKPNAKPVKAAPTSHNPPVPATFEGACKSGYYCRPDGSGYPCCYLIPLTNPGSARATCIASYKKWNVKIPASVRALPFMQGANYGNNQGGASANRVTVTNKKVLVGSRDCMRRTIPELKAMAHRAGIILPAKMPQKETLKSGKVVPGGWKYYICRRLALQQLKTNNGVSARPNAKVNIKGTMTSLYVVPGDPIKIRGFLRVNKRRATPEVTERACHTLDKEVLVKIAEAMGITVGSKSKPALCKEIHEVSKIPKKTENELYANQINQLLNEAFANMSNVEEEEEAPPPKVNSKQNRINNAILQRALAGNNMAAKAIMKLGGHRANVLRASKKKAVYEEPVYERRNVKGVETEEL